MTQQRRAAGRAGATITFEGDTKVTLKGRKEGGGGGFRNLKFDLLYKCIYIHKACSFKNLKFPTESVPLHAVKAEVLHAQILPTSFTTIVMMDRDAEIIWAHEKPK